MAKILDVYFHEKIVGQLEQDNHGEIKFTYSVNWLHDPTAIKISHSLPLQEGVFKRKKCRAFQNFDRLADEVGLAKPEVRKRILEMCDIILSSLLTIDIINSVQESMKEIIETRCNHFAKHVRESGSHIGK